jgi:putative membrane protein
MAPPPADQLDPVTTADVTATAAKSKSGSRTRDHLANERTYLAWMRTAIALIGFGVLIARLRYLVSPEVPGTGQGWLLGLGLACSGLVTVLLSTWHYFSVLEAIEYNRYEPTSRWVIVFSLVVTLLGTGVLYVLFSAPATVKGWGGI